MHIFLNVNVFLSNKIADVYESGTSSSNPTLKKIKSICDSLNLKKKKKKHALKCITQKSIAHWMYTIFGETAMDVKRVEFLLKNSKGIATSSQMVKFR